MKTGSVLVLLALALSACSPGQGSNAGVISSASTVAVLPAAAPSDLFQIMIRQSRDLGFLNPSQSVSFLLRLKNPSKQRQAADLAALYDPRSPHFGHFLTLPQWEARYGPSPRVLGQIRAWLSSRGISSSWQRPNSWLLVAGTARRIENVFRVRIERYLSPRGTRFWASVHDPSIPSALRSVAAGAGHLSSYVERTTQDVPIDGLAPSDMLTAYDMKPLRALNLTGAGETVAFLETDGFKQKDFNAFTQKFNLPPMKPIVEAGGPNSNAQGEAEMDLEVVHEIAPAAKLLVYNCTSACSDQDFANLEAEAARGAAHGIISVSLGGCEPAEGAQNIRAEKNSLDTALALGESVFVASGDSGAFECLTQNWGAAPSSAYVGASSPAVLPNVTAVGGTRLSLNADGTWYREEAWEVPAETAGTGGGVSVFFPRPSWQIGQGVQNQYDPQNMREVPDVSADADVLTSAEINVNGSFTQEGGTSQAAPIWAGMTALIDQYLRSKGLRPVGFMNPALYALAAGHPAYPPFHDVTLGSDLVHPATRGYDLATGLGTPDAWNLARDLETYQRAGHS